MIPRMLSAGKSFKWLGTYLTHDAGADTTERVAWTHTLNLASDHVPSAINEMYLTAENSELLKQEAGIRAGGQAIGNPVKHFSLNWSPEENPTREHMIETTEDFLRHMKWDEHQALLVAHDEKAHPHVHVMLNRVHPENGTKLDERFEYRRAQKWALEYEREHGIFCENRLENVEDRERSATRPEWLAFQETQRKFEREENARLGSDDKSRDENHAGDAGNSADPETPYQREWRTLKMVQKNERLMFVTESKAQFKEMRSAVFQEVREEFRPLWANYYSGVKTWGDSAIFAELKENLIAGQSEHLAERRDAALADLRKERGDLYREVLSHQKEDRATLRERQREGLNSTDFLISVAEKRFEKTNENTDKNREAEKGKDRFWTGAMPWGAESAPERDPKSDSGGARSGSDVGVGAAVGSAMFFASILDSLGDAATGSTPKRAAPPRLDKSTAQPTKAQKADDEAAWKAARKREDEEAVYRNRQQERYWE